MVPAARALPVRAGHCFYPQFGIVDPGGLGIFPGRGIFQAGLGSNQHKAQFVVKFGERFVQLAIASSVVRLLGYIVCIASLPAIRRKADSEARQRAFRLRGGYTIPLIGLLICIWLLAQSESESWIAVAALLGVGWIFYAAEQFIQFLSQRR